MLVANKIDLEDERVVSTEEGKELAEQLGLTYYETSALNKDIVDDAFRTLAFIFLQPFKLEQKV
jgi:GTPase SAR1 family protein